MGTLANLWSLWLLILMVTLYCQGENIYQCFAGRRRGDKSAYSRGLGLVFFFTTVCVICVALLLVSAVWAMVKGA